MHIQTVSSTTETSASLANLKDSGNKMSSEVAFPLWRRELRSGGGGGRGGGGGSSGGRGGGSRGGGSNGGSGTSGKSSGDCLKPFGLFNSLLFIGILSYLVGVR